MSHADDHATKKRLECVTESGDGRMVAQRWFDHAALHASSVAADDVTLGQADDLCCLYAVGDDGLGIVRPVCKPVEL